MQDAEFISFVESLDRCWMEGRLQDLTAFLAADVVFVAPGGKPRSEGIGPAIESYREFTSHAQIRSFRTSDYFVTLRGHTAVVEYAWQMTWAVGQAEHADAGRSVLVLAQCDENWRVVWRTQIPASAGPN
jgi:hypothetical protein